MAQVVAQHGAIRPEKDTFLQDENPFESMMARFDIAAHHLGLEPRGAVGVPDRLAPVRQHHRHTELGHAWPGQMRAVGQR